MKTAHSLAVATLVCLAPVASAAPNCAALARFAMPEQRMVIQQAQETDFAILSHKKAAYLYTV